VERQDAYLPPAEVVSTGGDPEYVPPPGFVNYWDWTIIQDNAGGVRTGRLATWLSEAARTRNPREILRRAVVARLQPTTDDATAESQALADLSVTGRAAFSAFAAVPLRDDELLALARPGLVGIAEPQIRDAVRAVLDRAYTVAWALRGSPSQRGRRHGHLLRRGIRVAQPLHHDLQAPARRTTLRVQEPKPRP
jgi:hypothetical protein